MSWSREKLNRAFNELRQQLGGRCVDCGCTEGLEFSHERPTGLSGVGRGKMKRYYDVKNNRDAYNLRCRACHQAFDRGAAANAP